MHLLLRQRRRLLLYLLWVMDAAVAARRSAAMARNRWIGLCVGNDDWLLLLLLLQLLQVRILCETRNWVVGGSGWRRRNQRWGHNFFRKRMKSRMKRIVHRTSPVPAATSAAVAPTNWSELNQRTAHLLLMILLPDLLMDKCQRRNNSAIHGSHEIRVIGDWVGQWPAVCVPSGCRHLSFAFDFDSSTALKLVRLMPQDLINFLRYLKMKKNLIQL